MDSFFQLTEKRYELRGLDRPYTLLHISDTHMMAWDECCTAGEIAEAKASNAHWEDGRLYFAEQYGDSMASQHQAPIEGYLKRIIGLANELMPDAVVFTGDTMEKYTEANVRFLERCMNELKMPYMIVRGNHELGENAAYHGLFGNDGAGQKLCIGNLKLIGIDDSQKSVSHETLDFLKKESGDDSCNVILMHIPLWTDDQADRWHRIGTYYTVREEESNETTREFLRMLKKGSFACELILCGHIHGCTESEPVPGLMQLTASSALIGSGNLIRLIPQVNK